MRIVGEWLLCDDGVTRPVILARVLAADGTARVDRFLIDSGADRTVFSAALLATLGLPATSGPSELALSGVGGTSPFVLLSTTLEFSADDGTPVRVRGEFAAFTDPAASDLSVLGRDVLNNFDLILSRPRREILILAGNHQYVVSQA
jgi:hypothetical protein